MNKHDFRWEGSELLFLGEPWDWQEKFPEDFDCWDVRRPDGWTIAHEASVRDRLPSNFNQWYLHDNWECSVADLECDFFVDKYMTTGRPFPFLSNNQKPPADLGIRLELLVTYNDSGYLGGTNSGLFLQRLDCTLLHSDLWKCREVLINRLKFLAEYKPKRPLDSFELAFKRKDEKAIRIALKRIKEQIKYLQRRMS